MRESDKQRALATFWGSFGVPAFEENTVPDAENVPPFPYITFEVSTGDFDEKQGMTANIWDRATTWDRAAGIADKIAMRLNAGGVFLPGGIWLTKGSPFLQTMPDTNDKMIRRYVINYNAEFITK